jgi:hypothetical protein
MSELLRKEQGKSQIAKQQDRKDQCDDSDDVYLHGPLPQLLAGLDVKERQGEENNRE